MTKSNARKIFDIVFWLAFVAALIALLFFGFVKSSAHRTIFGYSAFEVLTDSMQREIPQGSVVLVQQTDPALLRRGDVITFFIDAERTVTHEIVEVLYNYEGEGETVFQTQGVENPRPDEELVYAPNIIGKVVTHFHFGQFFGSLTNNWLISALVLFGALVLLAAIVLLSSHKKGVANRSP